MADQQQKPGSRVNIKIDDDEIKGRYSNLVRVTHTREEFVLDFMNIVPPHGAVISRIITSPGHMKRLVQALGGNLKLYEEKHGAIQESSEPPELGQIN